MAYQFVFKRYELKYLMTSRSSGFWRSWPRIGSGQIRPYHNPQHLLRMQRIHEANKRMTKWLIRRFPGAEGYLKFEKTVFVC